MGAWGYASCTQKSEVWRNTNAQAALGCSFPVLEATAFFDETMRDETQTEQRVRHGGNERVLWGWMRSHIVEQVSHGARVEWQSTHGGTLGGTVRVTA